MAELIGTPTWIEAAYGAEPEGRLFVCPACAVTWFGVDDRCWVCGGASAGSVGGEHGESASFLARIDDEA